MSARSLALIAVVLIVYAAYALARPVGAVRTTIIPPVIAGQVKLSMPWPAKGESAIGADGYGVLGTHNPQTPRPIASIAKVITAMAILEKKPLKPGGTGPEITFTPQDETIYEQYAANEGSVIPVSAGSSMNEYEALQAFLIPSANNIADTTAIWAFGSLDAYNKYATDMVKRFGMTDTAVADASGFSPSTQSTARDLVKLADKALDSPVLSGIVAQQSADFPGYGPIENVNSQLGTAGIRGIKTGNTDQAGGCYLAAADITASGKKFTFITAVLGATDLDQAMKSSVPLIQSSVAAFAKVPVVQAGNVVGNATTPWGSNSDIAAAQDISVVAWSGKGLAPSVTSKPVTAPARAGTDAGSFTVSYAGTTEKTELRLRNQIDRPTVFWRLTHPL